MSNNAQFNVGDIKAALAKVLPTLPHKMGVIALQFTEERFQQENWMDAKAESWKPRENNDGAKRAILVKSARLKRSPRITSETRDEVAIGTDVPYAKVHNEGSNETVQIPAHTRMLKKAKKDGKKTSDVKAHSKKMNIPKRQYIGESQEQTKRIKEMIQTEIKTALNQK